MELFIGALGGLIGAVLTQAIDWGKVWWERRAANADADAELRRNAYAGLLAAGDAGLRKFKRSFGVSVGPFQDDGPHIDAAFGLVQLFGTDQVVAAARAYVATVKRGHEDHNIQAAYVAAVRQELGLK